jgi:HSP20 family molecular chaperone IbpA
MATRRGFGLEDFERSFNEFFDELLIDRWKCGTESGPIEGAKVIDNPDRYEVRVAALSVDPAKIQVEVSGQRLALRMPEKLGGMLQRSFSFSDAIDGEASSAKWSEGTLIITLPKKKGRRISLKDS